MNVFGISAKIIPIGIHFFLMYAGICPFTIFGSTIAKQLGFSATTVGLIYFFVPLSSVLGRVILGMIADKYHLLKTIKITCITSCAVTIVIISFLPKRDVTSVMTNMNCGLNKTVVENRQFNEAFCQNARDEQTDMCEVVCSSDVNFQHFCSDWKKILPISNTFNCEQQMLAELKFSKSAFSDYACGSAKIRKVIFNKSEILLPRCSTDRNSTCSVTNCSQKNASVGSDLLTPFFWYLFILYITFGIGYNVAVTFSDTICFQIIGEETHLYGKSRVYGSIGWGLGGFFCGILIDYFSNTNSEEKNYQPMFIFMILLFLADILWSVKLEPCESTLETFNMRQFYELFSPFDVKGFAIWTFFAGFLQQIIWQYTYWYLDDISNGDDKNYLKTLQGFLSFSNTVTGDAISFTLSGWILKKLGYKNCMAITMFLSAFRFFFYSILSRPVWSIPISSLDGIVYGLQYSLITSYCNSIAAPGTEATVQAVFNCIFDGIGTSLGGLFGGLLYSWYGGSWMFRINCYISMSAFLFIAITKYMTIEKMQNENSTY